MLSFKILNEENTEEIIGSFTEGDSEYLREIVESFLEDEDEVAISFCDGCLLVRIFDGEYSFVYPIALTEDADPLSACDKIRLYAIKEEIPLVFLDVPCEELGSLLCEYRHASVDASDPDRESYTVRPLTEAALLEEIPTLDFDTLVLDGLTAADDADYARLSRDDETNRFWGYDYREDNPDPKDGFFREEAEGEFYRGVSMPFAVRVNGRFIGETTLYAFDYRGGCEIGIRILPEHRRKGCAGRILEGIFESARSLGLTELRATVLKENSRSVALCNKYFEDRTEDGNTYRFIEEI